jgi:hypothetical protein
MTASAQPTHFGLNCRHLQRDKYAPADGRCALAIARYAGDKYISLDARTPVPVSVAARILNTSSEEIIQRAKAGELQSFFPENIAKRIIVHTKAGDRHVTLNEAAKRRHKTITEIEQQITAGEIKADYPDELMRVILITRWDYERCPLIDTGGICVGFQPHGRPQIQCLADASRLARTSEPPL